MLLFSIIKLLEMLDKPLFGVHWKGFLEGDFQFQALVFLAGGAFLMYTAVKEISHMLSIHDFDEHAASQSNANANVVIAKIVLMNLIFSFDSILSALAITEVFVVLALAIVVSGLGMLYLADAVSAFLAKMEDLKFWGCLSC